MGELAAKQTERATQGFGIYIAGTGFILSFPILYGVNPTYNYFWAKQNRAEERPLCFVILFEDKMKKMKNCYLQNYNTQNMLQIKHLSCFKNVKSENNF